MAYPKSLIERARKLSKEEDLSAEVIADIFSKEAAHGKHNYEPSARTIRNWLLKEKQSALASEQINLARRHDGEIFEKSESIMDEQDLRKIVKIFLKYNELTWHRDIQLESYLKFFDLESNQFIFKDLRNQSNQFLESLYNLRTFIIKNSHPLESTYASFELWITGLHHNKDDWDEETWQAYHQLEAKLHKLVDDADKAYRAYRAVVRGTLLL
jgi:hypothetical protein